MTPDSGIESRPWFTLAELAARVNGVVEGDGQTRVSGVHGLEDAGPGSLIRVESERYVAVVEESPAAAVLAPPGLEGITKPCIRVAKPRLAFAQCLEAFQPDEGPDLGISPHAVLCEGVELAPDVRVGAFAVIGKRARLAEGVVIHPHAVLGDYVELGPGTEIFPHAVLYRNTVTGARVRVHSGAVIGADGYGYEWSGSGHYKIPQLGRVRLEDDVEIGANTTVDRATTGETVIGAGTKIDNLVQVGHNVRTGRHCLIISQVGIAGSTTLGNGVVMAGQAGIKDHIQIGDGAQIAGKSGVWSSVPAGAKISGHPAKPHREEVRIQAALGKLPALLRRVAALERLLGKSEDTE